MWLTSDGFTDGRSMPRRYACDAENLSPPLAWGAIPPGARSLAILCEDPDAPGGTFRHWAAYDISTDQSSLREGASGAGDLAQGVNDFHEAGYGGPCPPHGDGPHRYVFRLLALSQRHLALPPRPACRAVERAARGVLVDEAVLVATLRSLGKVKLAPRRGSSHSSPRNRPL